MTPAAEPANSSGTTALLLAHKIRLDPNDKQAGILAQHAGYARVAYNSALADFKTGLDAGEFRSPYDLIKRFDARKRKEYPWCAALSQRAACAAILNLGRGINARFGKKKDGTPFKKKGRFPRFKKKGRHDSFCAAVGPGEVAVEGQRIRLRTIGWLRMRESLRFAGDIRSCVVSKEGGRWFAAIVVRTAKPEAPPKTSDVVGIDLGVKTLAVTSDGHAYQNPKHLRTMLRRLRRFQRALARRTKGSNRHADMKARIALLHHRISNRRKDTAHKASTAIAKRARKIVVEDLNVAGMLRNRRLALSIADAGIAEFLRMLEYKAGMYGTEFQRVDRFFPSSKLCSYCGWRNAKLTLKMREWKCGGCSRVLDRDRNAARNLELAGKHPARGRYASLSASVDESVAVEPRTEQPARFPLLHSVDGVSTRNARRA